MSRAALRPAPFDILEEDWDASDLAHAIRLARTDDTIVQRFLREFATTAALTGDMSLVPSAREGLRRALLSPRARPADEVAVPALLCEVVGHAIVAAGLRPRLLDSGEMPGTVDEQQLHDSIADPAVRAVILPHWLGVPLPAAEVARACAERGVLLIEDCAHAIGLRVADGVAGTHGDFAVYSFGHEKPFSLLGGGLLVDNRAALDVAKHDPPARGPEGEASELAALHRRVTESRRPIGRSRALPFRAVRAASRFLTTGVPRLRIDVADHPPGAVRAALGMRVLQRFAATTAARRGNHRHLAALLAPRDLGALVHAGPDADFSPPYAMLLLHPAHAPRVRRIHDALWRAGFFGARSHRYPTLDADPVVAPAMSTPYPLTRAHDLARRSVDLPVHGRLGGEDLERLADCVWTATR